jgi:hypothetical protein
VNTKEVLQHWCMWVRVTALWETWGGNYWPLMNDEGFMPGVGSTVIGLFVLVSEPHFIICTCIRTTFHYLYLYPNHISLFVLVSEPHFIICTCIRTTFHSLQLQVEAHFILYNCKSKHILFLVPMFEAHFISCTHIRTTFHYLYSYPNHISLFVLVSEPHFIICTHI